MSLILKYYDEKERREYCWFDSSNVVASIVEDFEDDYKEMTIVYKGGRAYKYLKVSVNDYLMASRGSLDGSIGKAVNEFIKSKYDFEKIDNFDLVKLEKKKQQIIKEKKNMENAKVIARKLYNLHYLLESVVYEEMRGVDFTDEQGTIIYKLMEGFESLGREFLNDNFKNKNEEIYERMFETPSPEESDYDMKLLLNQYFGIIPEELQDWEYQEAIDDYGYQVNVWEQ
jgi:hypothetical protein